MHHLLRLEDRKLTQNDKSHYFILRARPISSLPNSFSRDTFFHLLPCHRPNSLVGDDSCAIMTSYFAGRELWTPFLSFLLPSSLGHSRFHEALPTSKSFRGSLPCCVFIAGSEREHARVLMLLYDYYQQPRTARNVNLAENFRRASLLCAASATAAKDIYAGN